jgi:IS5 family transposase
LLRALLLQVLYGYRSERRLMEEMRYNFALRWFVGLTMNEQPWDVTVFTKNRQRLIESQIAQEWLRLIVLQARQEQLLDEEHFSVDGTLIDAWASEKSYQPKPDPPAPGAGSGRRGNLLKRDLYESTTDGDARLFRKNMRDRFRLTYMGHIVMENGSGLIVASMVTRSSKTAERESATRMMKKVTRLFRVAGDHKHVTVGADKAYHEQDFVDAMKKLEVESHIGAYARKRVDFVGDAVRQTERYQVSLRKRKWIERCFAWIKGPAAQLRTKFRRVQRVDWSFTFTSGVYNLLRMAKLQTAG